MGFKSYDSVEDSVAVDECRPIVQNDSGLIPEMSGFCLGDFKQMIRVLVNSKVMTVWKTVLQWSSVDLSYKMARFDSRDEWILPWRFQTNDTSTG